MSFAAPWSTCVVLILIHAPARDSASHVPYPCTCRVTKSAETRTTGTARRTPRDALYAVTSKMMQSRVNDVDAFEWIVCVDVAEDGFSTISMRMWAEGKVESTKRAVEGAWH